MNDLYEVINLIKSGKGQVTDVLVSYNTMTLRFSDGRNVIFRANGNEDAVLSVKVMLVTSKEAIVE